MQLREAATVMKGELEGADRAFRGCSTDSRTIKSGELFIALRGERFDGHEFLAAAAGAGAGGALVDRNVPAAALPLIRVDDTLAAMGRLAADWRGRFRAPLLAITGSNGKTTVKEMLAAILARRAPVLATRGNLNNEIGVPLTLFGLGAEHRFAVLEMGANHPGEIRRLTNIARPDVAVITQCAPAHLEGFGSVEGVARAKAEIYEGLAAGGAAILNADDAYCALWRDLGAARRQISFGLSAPADVTAEDIAPLAGGGFGFRLRTPRGGIGVQLPLPGRHNVVNALAAAACCEAIDTPLADVAAGLGDVHPVKGRLERKPGVASATILDDTYNANPASLRAALDVLSGMPGRHWLVLGDMGELGEAAPALHRGAGELARETGAERLFALGALSSEAVAGFGAGAYHYGSVADLVEAVKRDLRPDVVVLVKGSRAMQMERVVDALAGKGN
jgi:UDP-N-acetylmuramoyl-tripeptide--D-alanyl-D-alanine ligase